MAMGIIYLKMAVKKIARGRDFYCEKSLGLTSCLKIERLDLVKA